MNEKIALYVLGLVARNPGKLGWYNVERTITNKSEFDIGFDELMALINSLVDKGFMDARKESDSELPATYWLTDKGQARLSGKDMEERSK